MDYQLTITTTDQPPAHRTITVDSPADLAQAVEHNRSSTRRNPSRARNAAP
jgi:hypothetical protein